MDKKRLLYVNDGKSTLCLELDIGKLQINKEVVIAVLFDVEKNVSCGVTLKSPELNVTIVQLNQQLDCP